MSHHNLRSQRSRRRLASALLTFSSFAIGCSAGAGREPGRSGNEADTAADEMGAEAPAELGDACDPGNVECADTLKCGAGGDFERFECVEPTGDDQFGESCTRDAPYASTYDSCASGLYCSATGAVDQGPPSQWPRDCRALCRDDSRCTADQRCYTGSSISGALGFCIPNCLDGVECPANFECGDFREGSDGTAFFACQEPGNTPTGSGCTFTAQCEAGSSCVAGHCERRCSAAQPCTSGVCDTSDGLPDGLGFCR